MPQLLKESAEIWENIARMIGITSTGVKSQMIQLLQDVQKRCSFDHDDQNQRQEVGKVGLHNYFFGIIKLIYIIF